MRQSLHHLVAKASWSDEALLEQVRKDVLSAMQKHGSVVAWIVDDTGFPKKGKHSVGVARQYGFMVAERNRFSPSARSGHLGFTIPGQAKDFRRRGSPDTPRAA